jgi:4-hydroxythreonine-4-phosphate dehydrogenase
MKKPLLLTMGDPVGIGPEIIIQAVRQKGFENLAHPLVVVGDLAIMARAAQICGCRFSWSPTPNNPLESGQMLIEGQALGLSTRTKLDVKNQLFGEPNIETGNAMYEYIIWACERCLDGKASGMITAPVNKYAMKMAGCDSPGHTEILAAKCRSGKVVMMLAGEKLKVSLVTTHCPFRDVPKMLTPQRILSTIQVTAASLSKHFGLSRPALAVLALNPHAGEGGLWGEEEKAVIIPAVLAAQQEGIDVQGPFSADTLFGLAVQGQYDAVICMYHDQGLIPLKLLHFNDAVNVTLGLPIVRTSVDHGTAYDLAGTGKALPNSLIAAVHMADRMSLNL